jgi:hypothetical protein
MLQSIRLCSTGGSFTPLLSNRIFTKVTQVPLDWLDLSLSQLVTIAIIRYNATDRTNYQRPIIINPGGPGGSGIWFIKHLAPYYQYIVGKNYLIHLALLFA